MASLPSVYLWAWERPEDLQFLGKSNVGVAFLAKTISLVPPVAVSPPMSSASLDAKPLGSANVLIRPRLQSLRIRPGTPLMAVVRIESVRGMEPNGYSAKLSPGDVGALATAIASAAQIEGVTALQIDFDATRSEQALYGDLLVRVRKEIPPNMPLSITALASWCIGDRWLEQLPEGTIDEAVPMLFRMGQGKMEVTRYLAAGNRFAVPACRASLGLATDEPFSREVLSGKVFIGDGHPKNLRFYLFSPQAWTEAAASPVLKELAQ